MSSAYYPPFPIHETQKLFPPVYTTRRKKKTLRILPRKRNHQTR